MRLSNIPLRKIGVVWVAHKLLRKTWRQYFLFDRQTSPRQAAVELFRVLRTRHLARLSKHLGNCRRSRTLKQGKLKEIDQSSNARCSRPQNPCRFYLTVRQKNGAAPDRVAALVFRR